MRFPIDPRIAACIAALVSGIAAAQTATPAPCGNCAVITSIRMSTEEEQWTPLGVVSSPSSLTDPVQARSTFAFGNEGPKLVMIGAAGGAVYAKRPNAYQRPRWDVTVRMDSGDTRVIAQRYEPLLREGDRVRVLGTQLELI